MISVGEHYLGPEHRSSRISRALDVAATAIARSRPQNFKEGHRPWVNVIFIVAGSLGTPEFDGIHLGHFSKKEKGLVVEVAVHQSIVDSDNLRDPIVLGLRMANAAAFHFFEEKGLEFPLREAEVLVTEVGEQLQEFA
jgi:hypothetical protein